jgi:hypothetical protein
MKTRIRKCPSLAVPKKKKNKKKSPSSSFIKDSMMLTPAYYYYYYYYSQLCVSDGSYCQFIHRTQYHHTLLERRIFKQCGVS